MYKTRLSGAIGILGGSFNPVHNGHLRMAIEVREALGLDRVELIPAHIPPHKSEALLPYSLRLNLVAEAVAGIEGLGVSSIEQEMVGPSYSFETVQRLQAMYPSERFVFIMGTADLLTLPQWHRGLEFPLLVDIAAADRGVDAGAVECFIKKHWSANQDEDLYYLGNGRVIVRVPIPRLDISSTLVREKFRQQHDLVGLVPAGVRKSLMTHAQKILKSWNA